MDGVELDPESVPDDEDLDIKNNGAAKTDDRDVSGYLQKWFLQLVGTRTNGTVVAAPVGEETGLVDSDMDDLVIEELEYLT